MFVEGLGRGFGSCVGFFLALWCLGLFGHTIRLILAVTAALMRVSGTPA